MENKKEFIKGNTESKKPVGTFLCSVCESKWDGSELHQDLQTNQLTCGDAFCGANVRKIDDKPKNKTDNK